MAEMKQNLPFRPLEVRGHGVWDPERKAFYPFRSAKSTVTAKSGIRYFVHAVTNTGYISGIHAASKAVYMRFYVNGNELNPYSLQSPITTLASDFWAGSIGGIVDCLCDPNTAITRVLDMNGGTSNIIYAEIYDDVSGQ